MQCISVSLESPVVQATVFHDMKNHNHVNGRMIYTYIPFIGEYLFYHQQKRTIASTQHFVCLCTEDEKSTENAVAAKNVLQKKRNGLTLKKPLRSFVLY